jgi:hypothetical protein
VVFLSWLIVTGVRTIIFHYQLVREEQAYRHPAITRKAGLRVFNPDFAVGCKICLKGQTKRSLSDPDRSVWADEA